MDYYVSGDSVPMGRLAFTYGNASESLGKKISLKEKILLIVSLLAIGSCSVFLVSRLRKKKQIP